MSYIVTVNFKDGTKQVYNESQYDEAWDLTHKLAEKYNTKFISVELKEEK